MNIVKEIILVGNGGCMREIAWQIELLNKKNPTWQIIGIVDKEPCRGYRDYPWLGKDDYLLSLTEEVNVAICIGNSSVRKKIAEKLSQNPYLKFPVIVLNQLEIRIDTKMPEKKDGAILGEAIISDTSYIGQGCIICMNSVISTDVKIGKFTFLNIGSMICHDGRIGDYVTLSPDVKLAGNVSIGQETEVGIGARVIQGITIGDHSVIGAGAVVVRDIPSNCTAVGVPAKPLIRKEQEIE